MYKNPHDAAAFDKHYFEKHVSIAKKIPGVRKYEVSHGSIATPVPIIMITAYGDAETKRRALENGAEALLTKPIDFGALRSEIETRIERAP